MINVIYYRSYNKVTIIGHALSGKVGQDLVCASASILAYTLANAVINMEVAKQCSDTYVSLNSGNAIVSCHPVVRYKSAVTLVFDTLCAGFEILSKNYPNNISYEMRM